MTVLPNTAVLQVCLLKRGGDPKQGRQRMGCQSEVTDPETWQAPNRLPAGRALAVGPLQRFLLPPDAMVLLLAHLTPYPCILLFLPEAANKEGSPPSNRVPTAQREQELFQVPHILSPHQARLSRAGWEPHSWLHFRQSHTLPRGTHSSWAGPEGETSGLF